MVDHSAHNSVGLPAVQSVKNWIVFTLSTPAIVHQTASKGKNGLTYCGQHWNQNTGKSEGFNIYLLFIKMLVFCVLCFLIVDMNGRLCLSYFKFIARLGK